MLTKNVNFCEENHVNIIWGIQKCNLLMVKSTFFHFPLIDYIRLYRGWIFVSEHRRGSWRPRFFLEFYCEIITYLLRRRTHFRKYFLHYIFFLFENVKRTNRLRNRKRFSTCPYIFSILYMSYILYRFSLFDWLSNDGPGDDLQNREFCWMTLLIWS